MAFSCPTSIRAEEAAQAVKACKYPPLGIRGIAPSRRAGGYGMNGLNYLENANEQILVMVAAETPEAVANHRRDRRDAGGSTASSSARWTCRPRWAISAIPLRRRCRKRSPVSRAAARRAGKFFGTVAGSFEQAQALYDKGYGFVIVLSDTTSSLSSRWKRSGSFSSAYPER